MLPSFVEYPEENRKETIKNDKLAEEILRKLEFKPGEIFTARELSDRARIFYRAASKKEIAKYAQGNECDGDEIDDGPEQFVSFVNDLTTNSNLLEMMFRFLPEASLKELKELEGRKPRRHAETPRLQQQAAHK